MTGPYARCALAAWVLAMSVGADCSVGREVVGERRDRPSEPPVCEVGLDCEPPEPVELVLPSRESSICAGGIACAAGLEEELTAPGASVRNRRFVLHASDPTELALSGVHLEQVTLELSGPITLRVGAQSHLLGVELRLSATGGEPQVLVAESVLEMVYVRSDEDPAAGRLAVERSTLLSCWTEVRDLELSTVTVKNSQLSAQHVVMGHASIVRSALGCESGWASGGTFEHVRTSGCGELGFTGSRFDGGEFGPCTRVLRFLLSDVGDAWIDGPVHVEGTYLRDARLGTRADTRFTAYQAELSGAAFCAGVLEANVGQGTVVKCTSCPAHEEELPVCEFGDSPVKLETNLCAALQEELPICAPPWPERQRP